MLDPKITILVVTHNMRREAARTLQSLTASYQVGVGEDDYDVLVVENGSTEPLSREFVESFGENFSYLDLDVGSPSPVTAINEARKRIRTELIMICIDGARILTPGLVFWSIRGARLTPRPVVACLSWHLGSELQNQAITKGYNSQVEDSLLASIDWPSNGYRLFEISCFASSSEQGWFRPFAESNCLTIPVDSFDECGGFDPLFQSPGGGLANHDFLERLLRQSGAELIVLLGEGTFHQVHGGVATNATPENHPWETMHDEYIRIRGRGFEIPQVDSGPTYLGTIPPEARRFLQASVERMETGA